MKKISLFAALALILVCSVSCTQSVGDVPVTPDSWKGVDFKVKKAATGEEIQYIDTVWNGSDYTLKTNPKAIPEPGDKVRVTAVRSAEGKNCGIYRSSEMLVYLKMRDTDGFLMSETLEVDVQCYYYDLNHFRDPYAEFTVPTTVDGKDVGSVVSVDVDIYLNFSAYGTYVDRTGVTGHEDPYLGGLETTTLTQYNGTTRSYPTTSSHETSTSIQIYAKK